MVLHDWIVLAVHQKYRRTVFRNMTLDRQGIAHPATELSPFSKQRPARTLMRDRMGHGNHRIDGRHKIGTQRLGMGNALACQKVCRMKTGCGHDQMTTRRKAHRSYPGGIDVIAVGLLTEQLNGALEILNHIGMLMASKYRPAVENIGEYALNPVFQHERRNAFFLKPTGYIRSFDLIIVPAIAATRADDHRQTGILIRLRKKRLKGHTTTADIGPIPNMNDLLCQHRLPHATNKKSNNKNNTFQLLIFRLPYDPVYVLFPPDSTDGTDAADLP